jgi:hypothetical protein
MFAFLLKISGFIYVTMTVTEVADLLLLLILAQVYCQLHFCYAARLSLYQGPSSISYFCLEAAY